ncbi:nitrite/sulfite reductase [Minwuia sp.]|uniref:nitrite/sulfite reductase n=1 Tax=Minwuia sp. TaxID=2493630 RepID=UPI003A90944A
MYQYDTIDRDLVDTRVAEFRDQVARRVSGDLSEEEFRPLRLMNGLYLQLHAYMLRVAIPYGVLSSVQMRKLARIARVYDRGYAHFTTRQNIQYNWPKLEETPDLLAELAEVEMHAIQTSGNCIRNTTADQFAGAVADEVDDPRIWSEIIRQWSTFHPEFTFLPRKFKIAVTGTAKDRAAIKVHDIGIVIVRNDAGETGFQMWAGGGQGRTPMIAKLIRDFLPERDLLSYLEAMLRVYNRHGRRDNKYKARIKILVHEIGADEYARQVEEEWESIRDGVLSLPEEEIARIRAHFAEPAFERLDGPSGSFAAKQLEDRAFARWVKSNVKPHKQAGYAIANISLKPVGGIPGDATAEQMDAVADLAERYSFGELRVAHEQNLVLPHVRQGDLYDLWLALGNVELDTPNIGLLGDIIACPGLDYCSLANARSIPLSQQISERFADLDRLHDIGEATLNISGCINACGHHHVANIGILGVDKKGEEFYQITLGGRADEDASIGKIVGPAFTADAAVDAIETIIETYVANRRTGERFIDAFDRLGINPFKEALYGTA